MSKIMVIEEDAAMRVLISEWLHSEGHQVRSLPRNDGVQDATIDLVILDLPHPRARIGETAAVLKAVQTGCPRAALIGISAQLARSLGGDSVAARAMGVSRLLAKPCTREELLGAVAATL